MRLGPKRAPKRAPARTLSGLPFAGRVALLALLLLAASLTDYGGGRPPAAHAQAESHGEVGTRPEYSARLAGSDREVSLEDHRGRALLLNVWATWCIPCREEMPDLQRIADEHRAAGLDVVGVSVDEGDYDGDVQRFARDLGVEFTIWRDPEERFSRTFYTTGVPETLLLDRNGVVVHRWKGPLRAGPETDRLISTALESEGGYGEAAAPAAATSSDGRSITLLVAFLAGLLSFLSPCVLPLIPSYVALITGVSGRPDAAGGKVDEEISRRALVSGLLFVAGFTSVFMMLGASATAVGALLGRHGEWISRIGGVVVLVLGLHVLGVLRLPGLDRDTRLLGRFSGARRLGRAGSFFVGMAFGAGWTPCIGPVLAGILTLAATTDSLTQGMALLATYSAGLAVPFLLATVALGRFLTASRRFRKAMPWVERVSGALLVVVALLLLTGSLEALSGWSSRLGLPEPGL